MSLKMFNKDSEDKCVIKLNKPRKRTKIAAFDFDWTLVKPKTSGKTFPTDKDDWKWIRENVPEIVKHFYDTGYGIFIFTNQSKSFKEEMLKDVLGSLKIPLTIVIGWKDNIRKPDLKLFTNVISKFNKEKSFYVGDAAGRPGDWSNDDKRFADNIGIKFKVPEEVFPVKNVEYSNKSYALTNQEVVILVGYPASGKTTFSEKSLKGYTRIDGDALKTPEKMVKEARKHLENGKSVIMDATNATKEKRKKYILLAKEFQVPVRCFYFTTSIDQSMENAKKRALTTGKTIPNIAFYVFRKHFVKPTPDECKVIEI